VTDVLLLHGAGSTAADWAGFALPGFTCTAVDLRGHGNGPQGPWTWDAVLDDLEALELDNPVVMGQSLGGMVAVRWGKRHPDCPAVVNLDGHGHPSRYPGLTQSEVDTWRQKLDEIFDAQVETLSEQDTRPDRQTLKELQALLAAERTLDLYAGLSCPALLLVATELMRVQEPFAEFYLAQRDGVLADLDGRDNVVRIDAAHCMFRQKPDEVTARISGFLTEVAG
jgi:pimeloyl-ACP methyl ester carboxylesterase